MSAPAAGDIVMLNEGEVLQSRPSLRNLADLASSECQARVSEARRSVESARKAIAALQTPLVTNGLRSSVDAAIEDLEGVDERLERLLPHIEKHFSGRDDG